MYGGKMKPESVTNLGTMLTDIISIMTLSEEQNREMIIFYSSKTCIIPCASQSPERRVYETLTLPLVSYLF
jgi:hypothetical protein